MAIKILLTRIFMCVIFHTVVFDEHKKKTSEFCSFDSVYLYRRTNGEKRQPGERREKVDEFRLSFIQLLNKKKQQVRPFTIRIPRYFILWVCVCVFLIYMSIVVELVTQQIFEMHSFSNP